MKIRCGCFRRSPKTWRRWPGGWLWRHHGSDGEHGSILDSGLRCAGTKRSEAVFGGCPWHEERTGSAHGLARMPVAAIICIRSGCFERHFDWTVMVCAVRSLMRHGSDQVQMASQHIQHMQKALTQMNVEIHHVTKRASATTARCLAFFPPRDASFSPPPLQVRIRPSIEDVLRALHEHASADRCLLLCCCATAAGVLPSRRTSAASPT